MHTGIINSKPKTEQKYYQPKGLPVPAELDLRLKGVSTPVKDQAVCGSCWTFGTAGVLEGRLNFFNRHQTNQKPLLRVSEQEILSCTWLDEVKDEKPR